MKKILCAIALFLGIYNTYGQLNDFKKPFTNSTNVEPSRSEFISYRRTSGTKGSPIDPALSFKKIEDWKINSTAKETVASAEFVVPFEFMDKALYLNVGATNNAATIFINDKEVGKRTDSKLNAEFNISKFVERGLNRIKIVIAPEKNALKIEQSDKPTKPLDDVFVFVQPKIRIFDITTRTSLDPTYKNGLLEIALLLKTELLNPHEVTVFYDLYDNEGKLVNQSSKDVMIDMRTQDTVRFTATIMDVHKWSHEDPYLYTVEFRIKREGRFTETMWRKVGFRTIETSNKKLIINGNETKIAGINAEMMPKLIDLSVPNEGMAKELEAVKLIGINAIRTPFPLKKNFYEVCDSLGLYVFETANINSQNAGKSIMKGGTLANDPAWRDIFVERAVNTYERAKVHPSVIAIGLGSDAGNGYNMYHAYNAIRKRDNTRLIVYNDAKLEWNTDVNMYEIDPLSVQPTILAKADNFNDLTQISGALLIKNGHTVEQLDKFLDGTLNAVTMEDVNAQKGIFRFTNNLKYTNLNQLSCKYSIYNSAGKEIKTGKIILNLDPGQSIEVEIPGTYGKKLIITIGKIAILER